MERSTVGGAAAQTGWSARMLRFGLDISDLAFAARLRREPQLRRAVDGWLAGADDLAWVEWEQRKHERLLEAA